MIATPVRHLRVPGVPGCRRRRLLLATPAPADAYIGPGAGFALLSSFFVFITTVVVAVLSLVVWPFRMAVATDPPTGGRARPLIKRLIIVGLDGQDPRVTDRYLQAGKLPNFRRLAESGSYSRLRTTFPSVSPVAWSSFSTGTNPARHNIFDFLDRDRRTYLPTTVLDAHRRRPIGFSASAVSAFRSRSRTCDCSGNRRPFWSVLGEHGIWSTILRVPITFPPDRFYGAQLSAMSVPDLRGTQGTFTFYTTRPRQARLSRTEACAFSSTLHDDRIDTTIQGPDNPIVEPDPAARGTAARAARSHRGPRLRRRGRNTADAGAGPADRTGSR